MQKFDLIEPTSLDEALGILGKEDTRVIGGGTALIVLVKNGLLRPRYLVSLRKLPELGTSKPRGTGMSFGACTHLRDIERSNKVRERLPLVSAAVEHIGNVRVRSAATVGGTICEADYQSDFAVALLALGGRVRVRGLQGERLISIDEFYVGPYTTALDTGELVTELEIDAAPQGASSAYLKCVTGPVTDRPCVAVAAVVGLDAAGACVHSRLVVGGVDGFSSRPLRVTAAEQLAIGAKITSQTIAAMSEIACRQADPASDLKASAQYKKEMTKVFCRRALEQALGGNRGG
ncbi:MAG: xanthine dehydrogenase family protein subunit M [Deltaproteobacteria bacterium]|nr:xanthine dehydrogenase family protein subunit M [Deltaproteobacteria bacterium]